MIAAVSMGPTSSERVRVLVVDDEACLRRMHARVLERQGYQVDTAASGEEAVLKIESDVFDVILSDIDMPGMNGIRLLDRVRAHDKDIPVVFITGAPTLDTAIQAIEGGALRYLLKPVDTKCLASVTADAVRSNRIARAKRQAIDLAGGLDKLIGARADLATRFAGAIDSLCVVYQPIISWSAKRIFAHEVLVRSREPGLEAPMALIDAAERLGKVHALGRWIRERASEGLAELFVDMI